MAQEKLEKLKALLLEAGFEPEVSVGDGALIVSVTFEPEYEPLPAGLEDFAWAPDQVERAMWKGSSEKRTFDGANFELALIDYAHNLMALDSESRELEATLELITTPEALEEYRAKRKLIWDRVVSAPEIVKWDKQLDELL